MTTPDIAGLREAFIKYASLQNQLFEQTRLLQRILTDSGMLSPFDLGEKPVPLVPGGEIVGTFNMKAVMEARFAELTPEQKRVFAVDTKPELVVPEGFDMSTASVTSTGIMPVDRRAPSTGAVPASASTEVVVADPSSPPVEKVEPAPDDAIGVHLADILARYLPATLVARGRGVLQLEKYGDDVFTSDYSHIKEYPSGLYMDSRTRERQLFINVDNKFLFMFGKFFEIGLPNAEVVTRSRILVVNERGGEPAYHELVNDASSPIFAPTMEHASAHLINWFEHALVAM